MVDTGDTVEADSVVAILAVVGGVDVTRWQAGCDHVVVAGLAGRKYLAVLEDGIRPAQVGMAIVAKITAYDMRGMFTFCDQVVVA